MVAYYNEIDPYAAEWLRNLIAMGEIAPGIVDERSIEDVSPDDLREFTQCHFFAGIGVWSLSLRRAGWPDDRPIWTGSCPCQPFSASGRRTGFADERHLWPHFHWLIQECKPAIVIGEQVASKAANPWIDLVQADLETLGYGFGCVAFPSASVGAPHIRDRNYWMGYSSIQGPLPGPQSGVHSSKENRRPRNVEPQRPSAISGMANPDDKQHSNRQGEFGPVHEEGEREQGAAEVTGLRSDSRPGPTKGFWADADWLFCRDGKWRPVEPGTFPLADRVAARVGRLRAYGNAINAEAATVFIETVMDSI